MYYNNNNNGAMHHKTFKIMNTQNSKKARAVYSVINKINPFLSGKWYFTMVADGNFYNNIEENAAKRVLKLNADFTINHTSKTIIIN